MKIFVTGATGYIGSNLTKYLSKKGNIVHALIRNPERSQLINFKNVIFKQANIMDVDSLYNGMKGCSQVYHLAAFARPWAKDRDYYYKINVQGTLNVVSAAQKAGIKKVVITSTAGVLGPSGNKILDEKTDANPSPLTEYVRSKIQMEEILINRYGKKINLVFVLPPRLYGPGELTVSNGVTKIIKFYKKGIWRLIPGNGKGIGNYVYIDDVTKGLTLAMEKGRSGERYIIGGQNLSYEEFFSILGKVTGKKKIMFKVPLPILLFISKIMLIYSKLTHNPPLITPVWLKKYSYSWAISSEKAKNELGYKPIPIEEGLKKTIDWLKK